MKILHCITGLEPDGAQQMLKRLVQTMDQTVFSHVVVSLRERMPFADELEREGARVVCLGMKAGVPSFKGLRMLRRVLRDEAPDLVQSWLYHANCAVTLAAIGLRPSFPIIWGVRGSLDPGWGRGLSTSLVIRFSALLSRFPQAVTFNSHESIKQHCAEGYRPRLIRYVANGFELSRFAPDRSRRQQLDERCQLPPDVQVIGIAGRFNRAKDYPGFLKAFRLVLNVLPDTYAVMVGRGVDDTNPDLIELVKKLELGNRVKLIGPHPDLGAILPAFDVFCSSSVTEGFPNVVAEALACAVPCVVTDVGMGAELVQGAGLSVPASQPEALSQALISVLKLPTEERRALGVAGREKICREFEIGAVARQHEEFYREIVAAFTAC